MDILIPYEYGKGMIEILTYIGTTLQKNYDISPNLINKILNDVTIINKIVERSAKFTELVNSILAEIDECQTLEDLMKYTLANIEWNNEICGHIIEEMPNGYKKYCDQHKYVHDNSNHTFIFKTDAQILESEKFNIKLTHYQNYLNKIFQIALEYYETKIKKEYRTIRISVGNIPMLIDWFKNNPNTFKTKFIIDNVTKNDNDEYIFNNFIDVYVPIEQYEKLSQELLDLLK